jgi:hypothetical protein
MFKNINIVNWNMKVKDIDRLFTHWSNAEMSADIRNVGIINIGSLMSFLSLWYYHMLLLTESNGSDMNRIIMNMLSISLGNDNLTWRRGVMVLF